MEKKKYTRKQLALAELIRKKRQQLKDELKKQGLLMLDIHIAKTMGISRETLINLSAKDHLPGEWKLKLYVDRINKLCKRHIK